MKEKLKELENINKELLETGKEVSEVAEKEWEGGDRVKKYIEGHVMFNRGYQELYDMDKEQFEKEVSNEIIDMAIKHTKDLLKTFKETLEAGKEEI